MRNIFTTLLLLLCCSRLATATIKPTLNVTALTKGSDVVVVGEVQSVTEAGRGRVEVGGKHVWGRVMNGELRVDRLIKGQVSKQISFSFFIPDTSVGYVGVIPHQYGMFFLRLEQGRLNFASPYYPSIVATRIGSLEAGDDLARVTAELSYVISSLNSTIREKALALFALDTVRTEQSSLVLRSGADRLSKPLSIYAAALLLNRNDMSRIRLVADYLRSSSRLVIKDGGFGLEISPARALENLSDKRAIPILIQLAKASDPIQRQCAVRALGNTKAREAIPGLAGGLEDSDQEVRWLAVIGLSKMAGEKWIAIETFRDSEENILNRWREWVKDYR